MKKLCSTMLFGNKDKIMIRRVLFASAIVLALLCPNVHAIHRGGNDLPYSQPMNHPLDKPINDKYNGKAFFMNLGPTGIRARIDPEYAKEFKVMFVFQDAKSPAKGLIDIGDHIIGANGKMFKNPHGFHRKKAGARGWQGPPYELALAIEDSQGKDGKLELMVKKGGKRSATRVTLQLKPVGRFSPTYPWNCPRSDKLLKDLCNFMIQTGIKGQHHTQIQKLLALMAAGDRRVLPMVKAQAERLKNSRAHAQQGGFCCWKWGYDGIFLGEYYNKTKDKGVLRAVKALNTAYELGQDWASGGFSHKPFPVIQQRIAAGGPKGYGSMAGPGGLSMLAQSIFKATGLPYSERAYNRTHQAFLQTASSNDEGQVVYGFKTWPTYIIRLKDPTSPCVSERGIGYRCPTGMKNIGAFGVEKWTSTGRGKWKMEVVPSKEFPILLSPAADKMDVFATSVYVSDKIQQRRVVVPNILKEPTRPFRNNHKGGGHIAPVGMGAVAHFVGNEGNKSWSYLGKHMATCCASSAKTLWDGHAAGSMAAFFGVLGAARADDKDLREFLDYSKTWIILSETHDGGLVEQPFGCQRNSTCSIGRDRTVYTHVAILLLSLSKRKLLITGAGSPGQSPAIPSKDVAALAEAEKMIAEKQYREATTILRKLAVAKPGTDIAKKAAERLKALQDDPAISQSIVDTEADVFEVRCVAAKKRKDYVLAINLYEQYVGRFPKATHFAKVKRTLDSLKSDDTIQANIKSSKAESDCKGWMSLADHYVNLGMYKKAREYLTKIIDNYGETEWGVKARKRLAKIPDR